MPNALITGGSRGLGLALTRALVDDGWRVVVDARDATALHQALNGVTGAVLVEGDVTDAGHRAALAATVDHLGGADLVVHNASDLGPSPLLRLDAYPLARWRAVYETNVVAPLALTQLLLPGLRARRGTVVAISSDAAREPYETWGGYGSSKAALDQVTAVLGAEEPDVRVYALDPGDMRTRMHQDAFPGEDVSDRPDPDTVVPAIMRLIDPRAPRPDGRYRAADLLSAGESA